MAERSVYWTIATNFSRARRDSERLARSLEQVQRQTEEMDETSVRGADDSAQANTRRNKVLKETLQRARQAAIAIRESAAAEGQGRVSAEQYASAQAKVEKALLSRQRASLALEASQNRLAAAEAKHGSDSKKYADALLAVQRRQLDVAAASTRHNDAVNTLTRAQNAALPSSNALTASMGRLFNVSRRGAGSLTAIPKATKSMAMGFAMLIPKFALISTGVGYVITALSNLTAGVFALLGPLGSLGSVLATIPQGLAVAGGALATFLAAFSGIGDALKAGAEAQKSAGKDATDYAKQQRQAARSVKMAERGLRDAREGAADSARNYSRALKSATEAVKDAKEQEVSASKNLSIVRKQARKDIEDMKSSLKDLALSERGAAISVEEARRKLQDVLMAPGSDELTKQQAQLAYDEALARMEDVKKEKASADKDYKSAQKKGVEGSDAVKEALEQEADAHEAARNAERDLADTRRDAARAARDSAESIADAQYALKEAQDAANESMGAGAAGAAKYQEALDELSPAGKRFVGILLGLQGTLKRLKFAAQEGLLPGLGEALINLTKLTPLAEQGLYQFGQVIGNFAKTASARLTSAEFMPMWGNLLEDNVDLMEMASEGLLNVMEAVIYLMDSARPFTKWLSETVLGWTSFWKESAKAGNETGKTAESLEKAKGVLEILGGIMSNIWGTFSNINDVGFPFGEDMLKGLEDITAKWEKWTGSTEGKNQLEEWFTSSKDALTALSSLMGSVTRMFFDLGRKNGGDVAYLLEKLEGLVPIFEELMSNLQGDFGIAVIDLIESLATILVNLTSTSSGGLTSFVETLNVFADVIKKISENEAGATVLSTIGVALGVIAALKFTGVLKGLTGIYKGVKKISALRAGGAAAAVAGAGGTAGGPGVAGAAAAPRGGAHKKTLRERFSDRTSGRRDERGSMTLLPGGSGGSSRGGSRRAERPARGGSSRGGSGSRSRSRAERPARGGGTSGIAKGGKALGKAGGAAMGLSLALSFLPGKIGEIAEKFLIFSTIFSLLGPILGKIAGLFVRMVGKIGGTLFKLVGVVSKVMRLISLAMMANPWMLLVAALIIIVVLVVKYWDEIKAAISKAVEWVVNFVKKHWDIIKWFMGPLGLLIDLVVKNWDKIKEKFSAGIKKVKDFVIKAWGAIKTFFSDPFTHMKNAAGQLWEDIKKKFTDGVDNVKDAMTKAKDKLKAIGKSIIDGVMEGLSKVGDVAAKIAQSIYDALKNAVNGAIDWINDALSKEITLPGGKKIGVDFSFPKLPDMTFKSRFATGGPVPGTGSGDTVSALLTPGEFVIRKKAAQAIGENRLHELNHADKPRRYAKGGMVGTEAQRKRKKKNREGVDGDSGYGNEVQMFAKGGKVKPSKKKEKEKKKEEKGKKVGSKKAAAPEKKNPLPGILSWLRESEVKTEKYTGSVRLKEVQTIRDVLKGAYEDKPNKELLNAFLKANNMLPTPATSKSEQSDAMKRALSFAAGQSGKPYVWGGVGPTGYDCSGYMSAVTNVIKGNNPYQRLFATGSMSSALPGLGFRSGLGGANDFSVGWFTGNPGHTSGTLGTTNVESTGGYVRNGSAARGASNSLYNARAHLPLGTKKVTTAASGKDYDLESKLGKEKKYLLPNLLKYVGSKTWAEVKKKFSLSGKELVDVVSPNIEKFEKLGSKSKTFLKGYQRAQGKHGPGAEEEEATGKSEGPVKTPLQLYLEEAEGDAKNLAAWENSLSQIANWGYSDLLKDLLAKGMSEESLPRAIEASQNQPMAAQLNEVLKNKSSITAEDLENLLKLISYFSASSGTPGLRDTARALGVSDYELLKLVELGQKNNKFGSVAGKMGPLNADLASYRAGTFYANTGGTVPGIGNGDTVPAMLTPGEFVIRKKAAQALGLNNLLALNGAQKFADGGVVLGPKVSEIPSRAGSMSASATRALGASGGVQYINNYDVDINNPIAEEGTRSMMKALQRQAVLGR